jgi:hypothetical protein
MLTSCKTRKSESISEISKKETTITERFVPVTVKGDTSGSASQLRVKDGKITIDRNIYTDKSDRAGAPIIDIDTAGVLRVKCPCLDFKTEVKVSDTKSTAEKSVQKTVRIPVNHVTDWQIFQIWLGRLLLFGGILWVLILTVRKRIGFFR